MFKALFRYLLTWLISTKHFQQLANITTSLTETGDCETGLEHTLIPRHILFGNPDRSSVTISPDGNLVVYLKPWNNVMNIWVISSDELLKNGPKSDHPVTFDKGRGISGFKWTYLPSTIVYAQDADGDENWKLYSLDLSPSASLSPKILSDTAGVKASVQAVSEKHPDSIIIGLNNRDPRYSDLYQINLRTGGRRLLLQNKQFSGFVFDNDMRLRLALVQADDAGTTYYTPVSITQNSSEWSFYRAFEFEDGMTSGFIGFDASNSACYWLDSEGRDKGALYLSDFANSSNKRLIYETKSGGQIRSGHFHPRDKTLLAVTEHYDQPKTVVMNETFRADWEHLLRLGSRGYPQIQAVSLDNSKWLVVWLSDVSPPVYYLYDTSKKVSTYLFTVKDALLKYKWAPMHPVEIVARDGLKQLCYLTLPLESDAQFTGRPSKPLAMVVNVHGGPWSRDRWAFRADVQWFANRGYAVMQCNFRGSTGFGKAHLNAGNGEWAGKMHDDLLDAVDWAVDNKVADRRKVAIYGASYGGYAALVGLSFTPDVFACGVDIVGPSNLITLIESIPPYWKPIYYGFVKRIGAAPDTPEGVAFLKSRSPVFFVPKIVKPLLIAQGANDPRVKKHESDQIVAALKKQIIPVSYLLFPDEGHGFRRPENKKAFQGLAEDFLHKCLGGRLEAVEASVINASSVQILSNGNF